jgi:hypothetical protein
VLITLLAAQIDPLVGLLLVFGVVYFVVMLFVGEVTKHRRNKSWEFFATELQSKYSADVQPLGEIKARVQNTAITIDGRTALTPFPFHCTRVAAPVSMPSNFSLILSPENTITSLGIGQDVILGDNAFDKTFLVRTNNELLCHLWLNAMTRPMLLLSEKYKFFVVTSDSVMLIRLGHETEFAPLKQATEICAKLSKHGAKLSDNWQSLAKRFQGKIENADSPNPLPHNTSLQLDHQGRRYVISLVLNKHAGVLTRIVAHHPSKIGLFSLAPAEHPTEPKEHKLNIAGMPTRYNVLANHKEDAERALDPQTTQTIQQMTPYAIIANAQHIELLLPGFVYIPETIQAALELVNHFISPSDGPYR